VSAAHRAPVRPVKYAVVPAGGLGTRFLPITRTVPKELLPIVDTAVIELVVSELADSGIEHVVLVIGPGKESVAEYFKPQPKIEARLVAEKRTQELELLRRPERLAQVTAVTQHDAKGNGHAVLMAKDLVGDEPFAMVWGDDVWLSEEPAVAQLIRARERLGGGSVIGCIRVQGKEISRYGVVAGTRADAATMRVSHIIEKPTPEEAPSDLAGVHGFVLEPQVMEALSTLPPGRGGEIWLTDAISVLARRGDPVWAIELQGRRYDAGDKAGYVNAFLDAALGREDIAPAVREHLRSLGWRPPDR
jgi:UTP--glucose-1-phosphate uridylyltransferase